jgi:hypothetical protein
MDSSLFTNFLKLPDQVDCKEVNHVWVVITFEGPLKRSAGLVDLCVPHIYIFIGHP